MKLRKYKDYIKAIEKYAQAVSVKIYYIYGDKEMENNGVYDPTGRFVAVDGEMDESYTLSSILHELGHFADDHYNPASQSNTHYSNARTKLENDHVSLTEKQKKAVWDSEIEAWKQGRAIARMLKIPLGKWFDKDEKASLNTYRGIKKDIK